MPLLVLIGVGAGVASAVLFASAMTGTALGMFVLFFLSPLPLALAGLGWTWLVAALGAAVAAGLVSVMGTSRGAVFHVLTVGLPTTIACYLLLLAREAPDAAEPARGGPAIEWYPIGRIVAFAALWGGMLASLALLSTARDVEGLRSALRQTFDRVFAGPAGTTQGPMKGLDEGKIAAIADLMTVAFTQVTATMWMSVALFNLWLAARITRMSGRLTRPWEALSALTLSRTMPLAFAAVIAATFLPDIAGLVAGGFAAALVLAYTLVGLAILHHVTQGSSARPAILAGVYAALVSLPPLSTFAVALLGLAEPFSPLNRKGRPGPPPPAPPID